MQYPQTTIIYVDDSHTSFQTKQQSAPPPPLHVFLTSYVRSVYVLCPRGECFLQIPGKKVNQSTIESKLFHILFTSNYKGHQVLEYTEKL